MVIGEEVGKFVGFAVDGIAASDGWPLFVGADVTSWAATGVQKGFDGGW